MKAVGTPNVTDDAPSVDASSFTTNNVHFVDIGSLTLGSLPDFPDRLSVIHQAEALAITSARACGIAEQGIIDPLALAASLHSTVTFNYINPEAMDVDNAEWVSAVVLREPNDVPQIVVAQDDSLYRRRFSLAHEIAHLLVEPADALVVDKRRPHDRPDDEEYFHKRPREYFADMFAHMFLMPTLVFDRLVTSGKTDDEISSLLKVSRLSVCNRRLYRQVVLDAIR